MARTAIQTTGKRHNVRRNQNMTGDRHRSAATSNNPVPKIHASDATTHAKNRSR